MLLTAILTSIYFVPLLYFLFLLLPFFFLPSFTLIWKGEMVLGAIFLNKNLSSHATFVSESLDPILVM